MKQLINYKEECEQLKKRLDEITKERNILRYVICDILKESDKISRIVKH